MLSVSSAGWRTGAVLVAPPSCLRTGGPAGPTGPGSLKGGKSRPRDAGSQAGDRFVSAGPPVPSVRRSPTGAAGDSAPEAPRPPAHCHNNGKVCLSRVHTWHTFHSHQSRTPQWGLR